ncbi:hypothetical protein EJ04DRAFT_557985 [Polyplosphaeria fusca]|uniref:Zn(2)-C6 fungal-type domain-containing protein n=1 Tax=Polyplosphaeria fusca TaxID=682080 RepID=A0A9P4RCS5_9PLEO|nr:hypothetical protein EJ04DRAFT_557985 [Polyplosphaeria fusca]
MPKARQTCTRCSMRRQKCDRRAPCSRCVTNKEGHLCTTEWTDGYNPNVHRKYPRKDSAPSEAPNPKWPTTPLSDHGTPAQAQAQAQARPNAGHAPETSLDFITFGRSDFSDVSIGNLLSDKEAYNARNQALMNQALNQNAIQDESAIPAGGFSPAARAVEVYHLRSLLPKKPQALQLVDYHQKYMLYWSGGIYHGPSFRTSLLEAYGQSDTLEPSGLDWRWTALLFSIMSASVIASTDECSSSWGIAYADKLRLAKAYGTATITSLIMGDFAANFHIYSIQAIINLHTSEHLVGSAKEFVVFQNAAIAIARGIGLHRLGPHPDDGKVSLTAEQKNALIQREMGRRVWYALVSQDWLCTTSQGLYTIQPRHFTTIRPGHFDEETMAPLPESAPVLTQHTGYLNDVALTLVHFQDEIHEAQDITTKYNVVLKYDMKMREMNSEKLPKILSPRTPFNPEWPKWMGWARRLHQTSCYHKIIMLHQAFLNRSFKDSPQFAYSRWACADAAKTIIEAMSDERDKEEPQWWVEQAFLVTAGITLAIDLFYKLGRKSEEAEYQMWIEKAISKLQTWPLSSLATHGVRLISSLIAERTKKISSQQSVVPPVSSVAAPSFHSNPTPTSLPAQALQGLTPVTDPTIVGEGWVPSQTDVDLMGFEDLMDTLPMEAGLDNNMFFESMLSLANSQLF